MRLSDFLIIKYRIREQAVIESPLCIINNMRDEYIDILDISVPLKKTEFE